MEHETLAEILAIGETTNVEFKRCGQQPERDTFETVCSFANTFGGSIFLGVEDDGTVVGVNAGNLLPVKRNVINVVNNPRLFDSPVALEFEELDYYGKPVLRLWVPPSPNMHRFKGEIYERSRTPTSSCAARPGWPRSAYASRASTRSRGSTSTSPRAT